MTPLHFHVFDFRKLLPSGTIGSKFGDEHETGGNPNSGLGVRVCSLGYGVQGLGFALWACVFRFRVSGARPWFPFHHNPYVDSSYASSNASFLGPFA